MSIFYIFVLPETNERTRRTKVKKMCKIVHVAEQIINRSIDKNISIDYFKVQKLAYLCQAYHLQKHGVALAPEKVYRWTCGAAFKEIYTYFNNTGLIVKNEIIDRIPNAKELLFFEQESVDYIVDKFACLDFEQIVKIVNTDILFSNVAEEQEIPISNIRDFIKNTPL